ncbi:MAG TPA: phage holin family protein [Acidimicrobiales bacterium]|nr:phage holin family protein [Acidimicrobiales bacterium]
MAATGSTTTRAHPAPADAHAGDDWVTQTADTIERVVTGVRSKTTEPVERISRIVVYGIVAAFLGITAAVLLSIAAVRALDIAIPGDVWSAHAIVGGIFTLAGLFLWGKRTTDKK